MSHDASQRFSLASTGKKLVWVEGTRQIMRLNSPHVNSSWSSWPLKSGNASGCSDDLSWRLTRRTKAPSARCYRPVPGGVPAELSGLHAVGASITLLSLRASLNRAFVLAPLLHWTSIPSEMLRGHVGPLDITPLSSL